MCKKKTKKVKDPNKKSIFTQFKEFITKGNVLDLAVGVVIGGAFNAIVTAVSNVLLSLATWGVPGGINGLVTVLPALNPSQKGPFGQSFHADQFDECVKKLASEGSIYTNETAMNFINNNYIKYGSSYVYKNSAIINWGAIINAVISFLIIGLTLFIVVKVVKYIQAKRLAFHEMLKTKAAALAASNGDGKEKEETVEEVK